jgi:hypothetical protein
LETHIKNGLANFIPKNLDKKKIVVKVLDKSVVFE